MPPLDFDAFRRALRKGEIAPAYYLHGSEELLKDDALRELLSVAVEDGTRDFNLDRRRTADVTAEEFQTLALTPPMMAARRALVLTEAEVLQQRRPRAQALRTALLAYLARPIPETVLILVQSGDEKPDPELVRTAAAAVEFGALRPEKLEKWIRHRAEREGVSLDDEGARLLHEVVGDDLAQLAAELAKLRGAVGARDATASDIEDLVGVRHGETVPDFVDAVTARRFDAAVGMVRHLLEGPGSSGVRLVTSLATALVGVALARAYLDRGGSPSSVARELVGAMQAARPMNLRKWSEEADRWVKDAARWSAADLDEALAQLLKADRRLKGTSLGGEAAIVSDALLAIAGAQAPAAG
jgi:DNA polymerase-3 subunit delta